MVCASGAILMLEGLRVVHLPIGSFRVCFGCGIAVTTALFSSRSDDGPP
jgi:hypothetical protein